ncbi:MAG: methylmalonyl-CoA mutase family protein [Ramlibacter sp.]|nr:methylmalonyl-CoA mutase family protein [Ramlibacter sp.]
MQSLNDIENELRAWEERHADQFAHERKPEFTSDSGIPYQRLYTPLDLEKIGFDYRKSLGFPGEAPFTRGITPTMYRTEHYLSAQYMGFSTPQETNALFKLLQAKGSKALHLAFDLPTIQGYDCDHPLAYDDVGKTGLSLSTLDDLEAVLESIDISKISVAWVNNPLAVVWVAMMCVLAERRGIAWADTLGFFQNDIIKGFLTDSQFIYPPDPSVRLATDVITFGIRHMPKARVSNLCCLQYEESACDEAHQLAFGMATGTAYIRAALERGYDIDDVAARISFLGCVNHRDFLCEVAKWRAARRLWSGLMRDRYGAKKAESMAPWVRVSTGGLDLIQDSRDMNVARGAIACLAMAFAGIQSATPKTYDEPLGIPSEEASITALRSVQLVQFETGVCDIVDPLGGSYAVEVLTHEVEQRAHAELERIEAMGGMVEAVKNGYAAKKILEAGTRHVERVTSGEKLSLGLNIYPPENATEREDFYLPAPAAVVDERIKALRAYKERRDQAALASALDKVRRVAAQPAGEDSNMIFPIIEAVRVGATSGEIAAAMKDVFGGYRLPW